MYEAWNRGELPGPADLLDADVEYVNPPGAIEPGVRRGLEAFAGAVAKAAEAWEVWQMEPHASEARGEDVAVAVRYKGQGRGSGLEVEGHESALWTIRRGRVVRYAWFHEPEDAFDHAVTGR
jgi:ketosteroid isomerase-like protein